MRRPPLNLGTLVGRRGERGRVAHLFHRTAEQRGDVIAGEFRTRAPCLVDEIRQRRGDLLDPPPHIAQRPPGQPKGVTRGRHSGHGGRRGQQTPGGGRDVDQPVRLRAAPPLPSGRHQTGCAGRAETFAS
ncbi:hypothetical protein AB0B89_34385 [Sphaerisporangium sp. NPDC049002]|uniref:hypothetical protein n=1 Tax=unclassified Sphaerisporangium TaxID=2630420 RepID=UPI0033DA9056